MSWRTPACRRDHALPTADDVFMLIVAIVTVLGLLALIGIGSVAPSSRVEAIIARSAS